MKQAIDSGAKAAKSRAKDVNSLLREIPSVDELLGRAQLVALAERAGRGVVTQAARNVLADLRAKLKSGPNGSVGGETALQVEAIEARVVADVEALLAPSLRHVINATGVILHTNLGRAPLAATAIAQIAETATRYSNLEYDIEKRRAREARRPHRAAARGSLGRRGGDRGQQQRRGGLPVLNTLAKGAEVVVSRGELIEIGDGFRIPDIMSESGAVLREVGTTNRTRIRDYERAINERTQLLLRVHPSNFRISGFTERPSLEDTGRARQAQEGSRCSRISAPDASRILSASGIAEPLARESGRAGVALISFSGDKLLGGPQAGIIAGKKKMVERIRRNPLFRALRVDKLTIAALETTLKAYHRGALDEIPAIRMILSSANEIGQRAVALADRLRETLPADVEIQVRAGFSVIGGGSTPDQKLPTHLIALASRIHSAALLEERLRKPARGATPVITRVAERRLILDLRTVFLDEEAALAASLAQAFVVE